MDEKVLGLHHITAIAGDAKRNYDFYRQVLGLRFIKKTVNFDDPGTYHFYYGDEVGTPGTVLTFFPWENIRKGQQGPGMATDIAFSVPGESLDFWRDRLRRNGIGIKGEGKRFGEPYLSFEDPDGLPLTFIVPASADDRKGWETAEIKAPAIRGFHSVTLTLRSTRHTADVLTSILGYAPAGEEDNRSRYMTTAVPAASVVDLVQDAASPAAINAGGTVHHVAFRVRDEEALMACREKLIRYGLNVTPRIDRNYFFSVYFREPGGVLFELATENPGFTVDEPASELGTHLKLPPQYESRRREIERVLPPLGGEGV